MKKLINKGKCVVSVLAASLLLVFCSQSKAKPYTIINDNGGNIVVYAKKKAKFKKEGTNVRFEGKCFSACTIYLGLPKEQLCVRLGATFYFHKPYGVVPKHVRFVESYMMKVYPEWVKMWITAKGGLPDSPKRNRYITMSGRYALKFLNPC